MILLFAPDLENHFENRSLDKEKHYARSTKMYILQHRSHTNNNNFDILVIFNAILT